MRTVEVFLNAAPSGRGRRFRAGDVLVGCGQYLRFRFEAGCGQDLEVLERAFEIGNLRGRDDAGRLYLPQIQSVSVVDVVRVDGVCCYAVDPVGYTTLQGLPGTVVWGADQLVRHRLAADYLSDRLRLGAELAGMRAQGGL